MTTILKKALDGMACALILAVCGTTAFAQSNLQKTPYLLYPGVSSGNNTNGLGINNTANVGNTSMEVLWQDTATQTDALNWGTTTAYGHSAAVSEQPLTTGEAAAYGHQHIYTITGLTPSTKYYYQVSGTNVNATGSFLTGPASNATAVQFLSAGDSRTNPASLANIMEAMTKFVSQPGDANFGRLILLSGDWVSADGESNWTAEYFAGLSGQITFNENIPMAGCKGNHDNDGSYPNGYTATLAKYMPMPFMQGNKVATGKYLSSGTGNQVPEYNSLFGSFDYGPVHITVVDEYFNFATGSTQYNWLKNDLAAADANPNTPWKILVYHEPAYNAGSDGDNTTAQQYLEPLVAAYNVDMTYSGHSHNYGRAGAYNSVQAAAGVDGSASKYAPTVNIPHITSGGGAAPIYQPNISNFTAGGYPNVITAWPANEFMTFNVNGLTLTMTAYQVNSPSTNGGTFTSAQYLPSQLSISPIETVVLNHFNPLTSGVQVTPSAVTCGAPGATTTTCTASVTVKNTGSVTLAGSIDVVLDGMINLQGVGMNMLPPTTSAACNQTLQNQYSTNKANASTTGHICSAIATNSGLLTSVTLVNATSSQNGEPLIRATSSGLKAGTSVVVPLTFSYPNVTGAKGSYLNSTMAPTSSTSNNIGTLDSQPVSNITFCTGSQVPNAGTNGAGGTYCLNPVVYQE